MNHNVSILHEGHSSFFVCVLSVCVCVRSFSKSYGLGYIMMSCYAVLFNIHEFIPSISKSRQMS